MTRLCVHTDNKQRTKTSQNCRSLHLAAKPDFWGMGRPNFTGIYFSWRPLPLRHATNQMVGLTVWFLWWCSVPTLGGAMATFIKHPIRRAAITTEHTVFPSTFTVTQGVRRTYACGHGRHVTWATAAWLRHVRVADAHWLMPDRHAHRLPSWPADQTFGQCALPLVNCSMRQTRDTVDQCW